MKKLLLIPALAILLGCGGGSGGGATKVSIDDDLLGSWSKDCEETIFDDPGDDKYEIQTIIFKKGGKVTYKEVYYKDSSCTEKSGDGTTTDGTYSAGKETKAADGEKAKKLDVHIKDRNEYTMYRFDDNKTTLLVANWGDENHDGSSDKNRANDFEDPDIWHKDK